MTLQANCADDKEQWVQLLQDGISTVAGSTYIHTSHESLRYTHTLTCCLSAALIPYEPSMNQHTHTHTLTKVLTFIPHPLSILLFPLLLSGLKSRKFPTSNMYMDDPFQQLCGGMHSQPIYSNSSILEHMVRSSKGVLKR